MAILNGYCEVDDVRDQFGDDAEKLPEAHLERAISATSRAIERWCGRRFWQDADPVARVYRPGDPVTAVVHDISTTVGLLVATDDGAGTYGTTWATTDYQLEPLDADADGGAYAWTRLTAIDRYSFRVSDRRPTLRVTAQFGWSAVPDEVKEAAILKAASLFKRKDAPFGVAGFNDFGAVRITRKDPDVIELLGYFVRYSKADA